MSNESGAPQGNPGDIVNWPMLKIVYRTDPDKIAALLPPGIEPGPNPNVNLTIYNFPVPDEPEYGISLCLPQTSPASSPFPFHQFSKCVLKTSAASSLFKDGSIYL